MVILVASRPRVIRVIIRAARCWQQRHKTSERMRSSARSPPPGSFHATPDRSLPSPPTPSRAFDVAISRATLPPEKWLALARRLVRPGGRLFVLTTPDVLPELRDREVYDQGRRALIEVGT